MSLAPRPPARMLKAGGGGSALNIVLSMVLAAVIMVMIVALHYQFDQAQHRLIKILLGLGVVALIPTQPMFGLFLFPIMAPFLSVMPKIPVPGFNTLNAMLFMLFLPVAVGRVINRKAIFPRMSLSAPIGMVFLVMVLGWMRGFAYPAGAGYNMGQAGLDLFRLSVGFLPYFVAMAMLRGSSRRPLVWALIIGLAAEGAATIALGGQGRHGRAEGTLGQANDLGAYLAAYSVFAAAIMMGVGGFQRLFCAASIVLGTIGVMMSVSRGAMVALALGLALVAVRSSRVLTVLLALTLVSSPMWVPESVKERIGSTHVESEESDESELEPSAQSRVNTWRTIIDLVIDHPLDGVGFNGLHYVLKERGSQLGLPYVVSSAHNSFFRMLGDHGLPGLFVFLFLLWRMWKLSEKGIRVATTRFDRQLSLGLGCALLSLLAASWFGDRFFRVEIIAGIWIASALVDDMCREQSQLAPPG